MDCMRNIYKEGKKGRLARVGEKDGRERKDAREVDGGKGRMRRGCGGGAMQVLINLKWRILLLNLFV